MFDLVQCLSLSTNWKNIVIYLYLSYFDLNICLLLLMILNLIKHLRVQDQLDHSDHHHLGFKLTSIFHNLIMITLSLLMIILV